MSDIHQLEQALENKDWETAENLLEKHKQDDAFKADALQILLVLEAQKKININEMIRSSASFSNGTEPLLHDFIFEKYLELSKLFYATDKLDLTQPNGYGRAVLHRAASLGRTQFVEWLLPLLKPADLVRQDQEGDTPLHVALGEADCFPIAKIIIKALNAAQLSIDMPVNNDGRTPLMRVARSGDRCIRMGKKDPAPYIDMVHTLVEAGADVLYVSKEGYTARDYAMFENYQPGTSHKDKTAIVRYLQNAEREGRKKEAEAMKEKVAQLTKDANLDKASSTGRRPSVVDAQRAERARTELAEIAAKKQLREDLDRIEDTVLEDFYYTYADGLTRSLDAYSVLSTGLVARARDNIDRIAGIVDHFGELASFLPGATFLFKAVGRAIEKVHDHSVEETVGRMSKLTNASTRGTDINEAARRFTIDCVAQMESALGGKFSEGAIEQLVKLTIVRLLRYVDATFNAKQAVAKSGWNSLYKHMLKATTHEPKQSLGKVRVVVGGKTVEYSDAALFQMITPVSHEAVEVTRGTAATRSASPPSYAASQPPCYASLFQATPSAPEQGAAESKEKDEIAQKVGDHLKVYEEAMKKKGLFSHKIPDAQSKFISSLRDAMKKSSDDTHISAHAMLSTLQSKVNEKACTSDRLLYSELQTAMTELSKVPALSVGAQPISGAYAAYQQVRALSPDRRSSDRKKKDSADGKERRATPPDGKEGKESQLSTPSYAVGPIG